MSRNPNAAAGKNLQGNAARAADGSREASGEGAAAANILKALITHLRGQIRVRRTRAVSNGLVVFRALIGIADKGSERRAAGDAVHETAENFRLIRFAALRRKPAARRPASHKGAKRLFVNGFARREPFNGAANGRRMALSPDGGAQISAESGVHDGVNRFKFSCGS